MASNYRVQMILLAPKYLGWQVAGVTGEDHCHQLGDFLSNNQQNCCVATLNLSINIVCLCLSPHKKMNSSRAELHQGAWHTISPGWMFAELNGIAYLICEEMETCYSPRPWVYTWRGKSDAPSSRAVSEQQSLDLPGQAFLFSPTSIRL
jgi:hypothetical protein